MVYKVGDKVLIKSIDWYNENKDKHGQVACGYHLFTEEMSKFCGSTMIVCNRTNLGVMTMGGNANYWTDEMIEGLAEKKTGIDSWGGLKVELELSKSIIGVCNVESIQGERFMAGFIKAIIPPEGYQFKDDKGNIINTTKIILEKKSDIQKFKYMKTDNLKEIVDILINYSEQLKELKKDVLKLQDEVSSLKIKLLNK